MTIEVVFPLAGCETLFGKQLSGRETITARTFSTTVGFPFAGFIGRQE